MRSFFDTSCFSSCSILSSRLSTHGYPLQTRNPRNRRIIQLPQIDTPVQGIEKPQGYQLRKTEAASREPGSVPVLLILVNCMTNDEIHERS